MSIKNKLVTAVTTAGLLAGLFGSAFAPAARAADEDANIDALSFTSTDLDVDKSSGTTIYALAGKAIVLNIVGSTSAGDADDDLADAGLMTVTVTGTVATSSAGNTTSGGSPLVIAANGKSAQGYQTVIVANPGADGNITFGTLTVTAPGAGVSATIVATFYGQHAGDEAYTLTLTGVAAKENGVPSATYSTYDADCAFDVGTEVSAGGSLCADSLVTYFDEETTFGIAFRIEDGYDADVTASYFASATVTNGVAGLSFDADDDGDCDEATDDESSSVGGFLPTGGTLGSGDVLCGVNDGTLGSGTVTLTVGGLTKSWKVGFLGSVASVTIAGPSSLISGASQDDDLGLVADALSVVAKDANGTIHGDGGGLTTGTNAALIDGDMDAVEGVSFTVTEAGQDVSANFTAVDNVCDGTAANCIDTSPDASEFSDLSNVYADADAAAAGAVDRDTVDAISEALDGNYDLPYALCGAGDEGDTITIKAAIDGINSNTISLTCVSDDYKVTGMTALATGTSGSATSGKNGQTIKVRVTAEDGYGRPAGLGSYVAFTATKSVDSATAGTTAYFSGGVATLTITLGTESGMQYVIYSKADGNTVTTAAEAFSAKISFTVTNDADAFTALSISTGPKGRVVKASGFNAGELVKFEVENALTGVVRTYNRKADANGVAMWRNATVALKYVTAIDSDDNLTDTISVKRK